MKSQLGLPKYAVSEVAQMTSTASMLAPILVRLPVELHLNIIDCLDLQDKVHLASTCRYLRTLVGPIPFHEFIVHEGSQWAAARSLFACKDCGHFQQMGAFADDMRKGKRSRHGPEAHTRICLECGIKSGLYVLGTRVRIYNVPHVVTRSHRAVKDQAHQTDHPGRCVPCWFQRQATNTYNQQFENDYPTVRSTRLYPDCLQPEGLYEAWRDA